MPEPHIEAVKITVGGEDLELFLNSFTFRLYELESGETLRQRDFSDITPAMMGRLAYIGALVNDDFEMSEKEFMRALAREDQDGLLEKVGLAIERMMGSKSKDAEESGDPTEGNGDAGE